MKQTLTICNKLFHRFSGVIRFWGLWLIVDRTSVSIEVKRPSRADLASIGSRRHPGSSTIGSLQNLRAHASEHSQDLGNDATHANTSIPL